MTFSVLRAELRKLWSIPALRWLLISPAVIGILAGLGGALADRLSTATSTAWLAVMATTVLATTLAAGGEFRHRTIVQSVLGSSFNTLISAKVIVAAAVGLGTGVMCGATIAISALAAPGRIEEPLELLWTSLAGTVGTICWAIIGVGLALLGKRSDILVVVLLLWCGFLEPLLVSLMYLADVGFAFVAGPAMASLALAGPDRMWSIDLLTPPAAATAMIFWALASAGGAWWMARTRELV